MFTHLTKPFSLTVGLLSLISASSQVMVNPVQAANLDLTDWEALGDIIIEPNQAWMGNAWSDNQDDLDDSLNPLDYNISGNNPVFAFEVEEALGLPDGSLLFESTDTSGAIKQTLTVQEGDTLKLDWNFLTNHDTPDLNRNDYAFISIGDEIFRLADTTSSFISPGINAPGTLVFFHQTGPQTFSYTFTTGGEFAVGIGVVDVGDAITSSALSLSNARVQAQSVPEPPLTLLGVGTLLVFGAFFPRKSRKNS